MHKQQENLQLLGPVVAKDKSDENNQERSRQKVRG